MYLPPGGQGITSSRRGSAGKRRRRRPGSATRTSETSDLRGLKFSILFIFESWKYFVVFSVEIYLLLWQQAGALRASAAAAPKATNALSFTLFVFSFTFSLIWNLLDNCFSPRETVFFFASLRANGAVFLHWSKWFSVHILLHMSTFQLTQMRFSFLSLSHVNISSCWRMNKRRNLAQN